MGLKRHSSVLLAAEIVQAYPTDSVDPDQTAHMSSLIWVHTVFLFICISQYKVGKSWMLSDAFFVGAFRIKYCRIGNFRENFIFENSRKKTY